MKTASACAVLLLTGCAAAPDPRVLDAARSYASYGRVDDASQWAPLDCEPPSPVPPLLSVSRDRDTHGRKLYYLFAKDREAYRLARELPQPVGQVLVKESWIPAASSTMTRPVIGERGPLFAMIKTGDADSDEGWIYATLTPNGRSITASGKIASCMECHQAARHDRLFGPKSCASPK